ncbi:MAG: TIGR00730 family Rossman fold protein [Rhodobacteraceae bacterium]|nr:TIGR00730 family Rossman fold protein [Alphaproteobacteria bacterium]NNF71924.1 TIGR00730 family Rossman fold protein [Paracoccaceae bacterium]NNK65889.1 TIGR00730 family Rossman fold protein [Paracoccaceae bacterium]
MTTMQQSACVFCGSRFGSDPTFREAAEALGSGLAKIGWRLVYGAGDVGLMGAVANATQAAGGDTLGVIPVHLLQREVGKRDLTQFVVTENMHERKKVMFVNSDAIVVLPGGAGSLDEFFEVLTWAQLGLHGKPIILLNTEGYWTPLVSLIDHVIDSGFAAESLRGFLTVVDTVEEALEALKG